MSTYREIDIQEILSYFQYNSVVILTYLAICVIALILNTLTRGKSNKLLFSSYRSSLLNPMTYVRMFTHIFGHTDFKHLTNNFYVILLIGPMIEEKYGVQNLIIMMAITAGITGILNWLKGNARLQGASGIAFMMMVLSSFVNIENGKIPITLVLVFIFYIVNEIRDGIFNKNDGISHFGHLIGAVCGGVFGFMYYYGYFFIQ